MNILMVIATPPDPDSGAAGTEYQTMVALRERGHTVDAIWADSLRHRIRHGNLHYLLELPWAYRDAIRDRAARQQYDVIHVNQPYAWLAARDHQRQGRHGVFVNRSHGWEPRIHEALEPWRRAFGVPEWRFPRGVVGRPLQWALGHYPGWSVNASDGIITSCSEDRDFILETYGVASERVACIASAPTPSLVSPALRAMDANRLRRILYVGQSGFFKGPHVLAAIFSQLAMRHPDLCFTWLTPASSHGVCRQLLKPHARERVVFRDWVSQDELVDCYDAHGVFIFPTLGEGFGKVFLEAMTRGLCVVASNAAGPRDLIRHHDNGCLVRVGDVDGFCREVERLLRQPPLAASISRAAAISANAYTWNRVADETVSFYRQLLVRKHEA